MTEKISVLDHGYLTLIETWGSDERIVEAARMSTGKGFLGWGPTVTDEQCRVCLGEGEVDDRGSAFVGQPFMFAKTCPSCGGDKKDRKQGDEKLLRFLYENKHATPFEMAGMVIEIQAPIFVFREWHRHRTQSYAEMSARYTPLPDVNYVPTSERLMMVSKANKQAATIAGSETLTDEAAGKFREALEGHYVHCEQMYQWALEMGVPKELARVHLPVGRYSRMRASANLRNWLAFLTLRMAPNAQWEIQMYANAVGQLIADRFPRTWELFAEGRK